MEYSLEDIKTMLDAITPGEWVATSNDTSVFSHSVVAFPDGTVLARIERDQDRAFIAAAPSIVRALVAREEIYRKGIEVTTNALAGMQELARAEAGTVEANIATDKVAKALDALNELYTMLQQKLEGSA